jgi:phenylalanyl-tRNA synthetase beta chain
LKVSVNWLKQYVDLEGISVDELVEVLTTAGLEVDEVIDQKKQFENFVVGYVKETKKHPNADKLTLCVVSDGDNDYNVVCGAPNVDKNQKVPFAKVGAVVPEGSFEIKKAKIRGEESKGMICSEKELGLGDDASGILVMDESLEEGTPLSEAIGANDVILDIEFTPNRADALSHVGIARDLAAIFDKEVKVPEVALSEINEKSSDFADVEIENPEGCPRYVAKVVRDIEITESPGWLKQRLLNIGLRPINNVVDVTNFILYEIGQPLHAFDLDNLAGNKIVVRRAGNDNKFVTLDSKERTLQPDDLMICDARKPVAIAGVMGGENSEVSENTKNILIESAYFNPSSIRKTSKLLGLSTDSSYRFERGCDPEITKFAAQRAADLIAEIGKGKVAAGEIDEYPEPLKRKQVQLRISRITKVLGFEIPNDTVRQILEKLELKILVDSDDTLLIEVPLFRHDIEREIDLIEEVARIYGYDKVPEAEKAAITLEAKIDQSEPDDKLRNILAGLGLNEIITNSLLREDIAVKFGNPIKVLNPQSIDMSHTRPSLLPGALMTVAKNIKVRETNLQLFEIGKIFNRKHDQAIQKFEDFDEEEHLLITITGKTGEDEWYGKARDIDFYDLKGIVDEFLTENSLDNILIDSYYNTSNKQFEYYYEKRYDNNLIGIGGKIDQKLLKEFEIEQPVFVFDFNLDALRKVPAWETKFAELLKFPKVIRDVAFVVDKNIDAGTVINNIRKNSSNLLQNIKLFDIFESESLGKHKKSLAFQLDYFDTKRTLKEEEVDKDFWNMIDKVKTKLQAELRGV